MKKKIYVATGCTRKEKLINNVVVGKEPSSCDITASGQLLTICKSCWNGPPLQSMHNWAMLSQKFMNLRKMSSHIAYCHPSPFSIILQLVPRGFIVGCKRYSPLDPTFRCLQEWDWVIAGITQVDRANTEHHNTRTFAVETSYKCVKWVTLYPLRHCNCEVTICNVFISHQRSACHHLFILYRVGGTC
jgi:hypothetical protein